MADEKKKKQKKPTIGKGAKGSRAEKLAHVITGAKKEFSKSVMSSALAEKFTVVKRISTGLYGLDAMSNGGLPVGRATLAYGPASGGKTSLFLRGVGNAQKLCANCYEPGILAPGEIELPDFKTGEIKSVKTDVLVECPCGDPRDMLILWTDAERVWATDWAIKMGVAPEKVIVLTPAYGEQAFDVISAFVEIKEIDIIVIDSIAACTPKIEMEAGIGEQQQGMAARINNKFIRKIISGVCDAFQEDRFITPWLINQYREKIGVQFGSPDVLPGGKGQLFATSLDIELRKGTVKVDEDGGPIYGDFKYKVKKNKVGTDGGKGEFSQCMADTDLFRVGDLMEHDYVIGCASDLGLVGRPNKVMYEFDGKSFRGKSQLVRHLGENPELYGRLKEEMLGIKLGISEYVEDEEEGNE